MESNSALANTNTDMDLQERVSDAIRSQGILRGTRAHVNVTVAGGHVTIDGVVQSPMAAAEVERAATDVAGAGSVTSRLTDDATLSRRVAEVLARDARTAVIPPGYEVASLYGHVSLVGQFTVEQSQALEAVCRAVPGVRTVAIRLL